MESPMIMRGCAAARGDRNFIKIIYGLYYKDK